MINAWTMFYSALTVTMLMPAILSPVRSLHWAAYVIAASFVLSNLSTFSVLPYGVYYPLMDAMMGLLFLIRWGIDRAMWLGVIASLFVAMMAIHALYLRIGAFTLHQYDLALNTLYIGQLATLGYCGIRARATA